MLFICIDTGQKDEMTEEEFNKAMDMLYTSMFYIFKHMKGSHPKFKAWKEGRDALEQIFSQIEKLSEKYTIFSNHYAINNRDKTVTAFFGDEP